MVGACLVLVCQRTGCDSVETIAMGELDGPELAVAHSVAQTLAEEWPEGWGWDAVGLNRVLHCPEHRHAG